jgi:hypothetical protein
VVNAKAICGDFAVSPRVRPSVRSSVVQYQRVNRLSNFYEIIYKSSLSEVIWQGRVS